MSPLHGFEYSVAWMVVGSGVLVIGASLAIGWAYGAVLAHLRRNGHISPQGPRAWHIATIAVVLSGYVAVIDIAVLELLGFPLTIARPVRLVGYEVLNVLALVSLAVISKVVRDRALAQHRRGRRHRAPRIANHRQGRST